MTTMTIPTRITVDFRETVHPSRSWILDVNDSMPERVDLITFEAPAEARSSRPTTWRTPERDVRGSATPAGPTALSAECACPEFCERDHANE